MGGAPREQPRHGAHAQPVRPDRRGEARRGHRARPLYRGARRPAGAAPRRTGHGHGRDGATAGAAGPDRRPTVPRPVRPRAPRRRPRLPRAVPPRPRSRPRGVRARDDVRPGDHRGGALAATLSHRAGSGWTEALETTIATAFRVVSSALQQGAASGHGPARVGATVVDVLRPTRDVVVVRLLTDVMVDYHPGQHL